MTNPKQQSLYDEYAATQEGGMELAAADLCVRAAEMMNRGTTRTGTRPSQIAKRLRVTASRVSQLLGGDGNVRLSSLAKFMYALGYDVHLHAIPRPGSGSPPLETSARRRVRSSAPTPLAWNLKGVPLGDMEFIVHGLLADSQKAMTEYVAMQGMVKTPPGHEQNFVRIFHDWHAWRPGPRQDSARPIATTERR